MPTAPEIPAETVAKPEQQVAFGDEQDCEADYRGLPLRRLLPLGQLFLCVVLLFPYRAGISRQVFGLRLASNEPRPSITVTPDETLNLILNDPGFERRFKARENTFDLVSALELPCIVVELPYGILSQDHGYWTPGHIEYNVWRAVTWPLLALPLWWVAGRGLEAVLAARRNLISPRIGWSATVFSFLLMAGGATLAIGFLFAGPDRADHQFQVFVAGAAIWAVLGSFTVIAKLAQWRIKKRALSLGSPQRAQKDAEAAPFTN